jgi:hypothetical protein
VNEKTGVPPIVQQTRKFSISVSNDVWRIDIESAIRLAEACFDGTNVYEYLDYRSGSTFAAITKGPYPTDLEWDKRLLWFVYAMPLSVRNQNRLTFPAPWGDARNEVLPNCCRSDLQWGSKNEVSPMEVRFSYDAEVLESNITHMTLWPVGSTLSEREVEIERVHQYSDGLVLATYKVVAWTNLGLCSIPSRWILKRIPTEVPVTYEYEGTIDICSNLSSEIWVKPSRPVRVIDTRVRNVGNGINYVSYVTTNGEWIALSQLRVPLPNKDYFLRTPVLRSPRRVFVSILAVLVVAPVVVYLYYILRCKLTTKPTSTTNNS